MKPYFSILVPVFNQVGLMDKHLNSLKAQTFKDFEVIFVDDGSTDDSYNMLMGLAKEDSRYKVVKHDGNKSLATARYTGMENVSGQYVLFLDSDDYYEDNALEVIHDYIEENPECDCIRFGYYEDREEEEISGLLGEKQIEKPALDFDDPFKALINAEITPTIWKNCYSAELIKKAKERTKPIYCNMGEDVFWGTVFFSCATKFGRIDKCLHHYLIGTGMSTQFASAPPISKMLKHMESVKNCGDELTEYISKYEPQYNDYVKKKISTMYKYVLLICIIGQPDVKTMMEYVNVFKENGMDDVYTHGCNQTIPYILRMQMGIFDDVKAHDEFGLTYKDYEWD